MFSIELKSGIGCVCASEHARRLQFSIPYIRAASSHTATWNMAKQKSKRSNRFRCCFCCCCWCCCEFQIVINNDSNNYNNYNQTVNNIGNGSKNSSLSPPLWQSHILCRVYVCVCWIYEFYEMWPLAANRLPQHTIPISPDKQWTKKSGGQLCIGRLVRAKVFCVHLFICLLLSYNHAQQIC